MSSDNDPDISAIFVAVAEVAEKVIRNSLCGAILTDQLGSFHDWIF